MSDPDAATIAGCQRGERSAQQQLFEHCHCQVYQLCSRLVNDQDVDDLVQQVFIRVYLTIGQFSGRSRFQTWIYRLVVNECLQHIRCRRRVPEVALVFEPIGVDVFADIEHEDLLDAALKRLEPQLRTVFVLRELNHMTYGEIAKIVDLSEGTVASRLSRARVRMKQLLVDLGWGV